MSTSHPTDTSTGAETAPTPTTTQTTTRDVRRQTHAVAVGLAGFSLVLTAVAWVVA